MCLDITKNLLKDIDNIFVSLSTCQKILIESLLYTLNNFLHQLDSSVGIIKSKVTESMSVVVIILEEYSRKNIYFEKFLKINVSWRIENSIIRPTNIIDNEIPSELRIVK